MKRSAQSESEKDNVPSVSELATGDVAQLITWLTSEDCRNNKQRFLKCFV